MLFRSVTLILWLLVHSVLGLGGSQSIRALKQKVADEQAKQLRRRDIDPSLLYPEHNLSVPIDHFHNESRYEPHSDGTFNMRYWFDPTFYKPGGPVIALQGGETGGDDRLPYLQKGIVRLLSEATNGLGVILEHRYYGTSFPTPDLSNENLRFLTTDQAMADMAFFAQNIKFPGLETTPLNSPDTAWIAYGGSYAGAFVAILRTLYPDVFFGSISSSGVTEAIYDYWQYFVPLIEFGPQDCVSTQQKFTGAIDKVLLGTNETNTKLLQSAFGLPNLTHVADFASILSDGIYGWQNTNWDPAVNDPSFDEFCSAITNDTLIFPNSTTGTAANIRSIFDAAGDYTLSSPTLTNRMLNYIGFIKTNFVTGRCGRGETQDECFSNLEASFFEQDDLSQWPWRSWAHQYCDQWGYLQTGSGFPADEQGILSRTIDIPYESFVCRAAFGINRTSDVGAINKFGGFNISFPRLAIIGGQADPWRDATPLADGAAKRTSTVDQPVIEIVGAVHHWDENGLFPNQTTATLPPQPIKDAQSQEQTFVKAWLSEFRLQKLMRKRLPRN